MKRRKFLSGIAAAPFVVGSGIYGVNKQNARGALKSESRVQYSVNAYSFNSMLREGKMNFFDMMEFAADIGLDAVDMTGYYFSGYPDVPGDNELFDYKQRALKLGISIPWTGVRNDFVTPDDESRRQDRELVKAWLKVSSKLGASIMRVFTGKDKAGEYNRSEAMSRLVNELRICCRFAEEEGVMIGLQHHNDFLYSSGEVIEVIKRVNSKWLGLILDVGSLRRGDSYMEISNLAPYATYWFIKEHVYPNGEKQPVDMKKIAGIIKDNNYRGYISFESLSEEDPRKIVTKMVNDFREVY